MTFRLRKLEWDIWATDQYRAQVFENIYYGVEQYYSDFKWKAYKVRKTVEGFYVATEYLEPRFDTKEEAFEACEQHLITLCKQYFEEVI
jgi:hypothetical protein